MKSSAPGRIITLSSLAHHRGEINFDDLNSSENYNKGQAYSNSKLANVLFTHELNKRLKGKIQGGGEHLSEEQFDSILPFIYKKKELHITHQPQSNIYCNYKSTTQGRHA